MRSEISTSGGLWHPQWGASPRVDALMSTREGGVSTAPWDSLNLGTAVGDDAAAVAENRRRYAAMLGAAPVWLRQVHGTAVVRLTRDAIDRTEPLEADAAWTDEPMLACTVQVADCLPVLWAAPQGRAVATSHAGWRGLVGGVLEATLQALCDGAACAPQDLEVWLGPCIGPRRFEVGADVLAAFGADARPQGSRNFAPGRDSQHWLADLSMLARNRLERAGVRQISGGTWCTFEDRSRFFSHRRDGVSGRLAASVWIRG
jgi:polyphenol oxidase